NRRLGGSALVGVAGGGADRFSARLARRSRRLAAETRGDPRPTRRGWRSKSERSGVPWDGERCATARVGGAIEQETASAGRPCEPIEAQARAPVRGRSANPSVAWPD